MQNYISIFDLFSVGIGPSSSHSVGPMRAMRLLLDELGASGKLTQLTRLKIKLYGSLALTGKGHGTDTAIVLGLLGQAPETHDPNRTQSLVNPVIDEQRLCLDGQHTIDYCLESDIQFLRKETLDFHPNGMICQAYNRSELLLEKTYFSVGGGFVVEKGVPLQTTGSEKDIPYSFDNAAELLRIADTHQMAISQVVWENEKCFRTESEIRERILLLWEVMQQCVQRGCEQTGVLPGGLQVERRAAALLASLQSTQQSKPEDPLTVLDWVDLFALAVNEENAAGGRVVTAPTNGAAGILPAVLHYYDRFCPGSDNDGIVKFFLTAGAIGKLYKKNASISGAEVGCQGEVGVACSMAAGALTEVLGGNPRQVEEAAEIGMEHNLGLTCDPIGGLVQVPCIERNAMGAVKAINASRLALRGDGQHRVSLDKVIATMRRTGEDMLGKYKETARGGLALHELGANALGVNVTEC
ncbi:MAG: L-serine ammonia-lyase [Planctomycetota bacterium]|nr:L-serine ammonia-lyase [Planctomycetota bacterium]